MGRKTIGKTIAALRKARGMTQKELGEKLFVSDKTISRWERDECEPELSLIPMIAKLFSVTADELLLGECCPKESEKEDGDGCGQNDDSAYADASDVAAVKKARAYRQASAVSVCIAALGLVAAIIANCGFSKGLFAFCAALIFCCVSETILICAYFRLKFEQREGVATNERCAEENARLFSVGLKITLLNAMIVAFCLPLVTLIDGRNFGLRAEYWLLWGAVFVAVAIFIVHIAYVFWLKKLFAKKGLIVLSEEGRESLTTCAKRLKKAIFVGGGVACVFLAAAFAVNCMQPSVFFEAETFETCEAFKAFVEGEYDDWVSGKTYEYGNNVLLPPTNPIFPSEDGEQEAYPSREVSTVYGEDGSVLCEYYYNPDFYSEITFSASADKMPVRVVTRRAYYNALEKKQAILGVLYGGAAVAVVAASGTYAVCARVALKRAKRKESVTE